MWLTMSQTFSQDFGGDEANVTAGTLEIQIADSEVPAIREGTFAERFGELRTRSGFTKTALARPRYTVSYVSQIEAGRRRPSPEAMAFFAARLGVSPGYLSSGVPEELEERLGYRLEEARRTLDSAPERTLVTIKRILEVAERYGLRTVASRTLVAKGQALMKLGRVREAIDAFEEALDRGLPDLDAGMTVVSLARAYRGVGDLSYAADLVESFLSKRDRGPLDPAVAAELQTALVSIYFERGDVVRAERSAGRALAAAEQCVSVETRARTYWAASRVLAESKRWSEALQLATQARLLLEQVDDRRRVGRLHNAYAFICLEADPPRTAEASTHLDRAEALLQDDSSPADFAYVHTERSRLALLEGRPEDALAFAERALLYVEGDELEEGRVLFLRGRALALLDRGDEARAAFEDAASRFSKVGARQQIAASWRELGELHIAAGDMEAAVESLRAGLEALDPRRSRA